SRHLDWVARGGRRRTRQTPRQAAMLLRNLEEAKKLLEAEEACNDPLRMIPYLLENKAVQGCVVAIERSYKELIKKRRMARPLVTIRSADPCHMPVGKELWWAANPNGKAYEVHSIRTAPDGQTIVTLKLTTSADAVMPSLGEVACFSI